MSNAEASSVPAPMGRRVLIRVEVLPVERHPSRRHVPLLALPEQVELFPEVETG